jgi:hypothetical protein
VERVVQNKKARRLCLAATPAATPSYRSVCNQGKCLMKLLLQKNFCLLKIFFFGSR